MIEKLKKIFVNLGIISIIAFLGALSGQNWKWLRRYLIPLIVTATAYFLLQNWWVLTCYSMAGALSIGYGIISPDDDKPSFLGKVAYNLFPKSQTLQNVFCRGTVGTLLSLSMLSVPILQSTWHSFLIGSVIIIGVWSAVSWRGFGETKVKLFGKEISLLNVDLTTYAVTAVGLILIVNGWIG